MSDDPKPLTEEEKKTLNELLWRKTVTDQLRVNKDKEKKDS